MEVFCQMIRIPYIKPCTKGEVLRCIVVNSEAFLIKLQIDGYSPGGRGADHGIIGHIVKVDRVDVPFINKAIPVTVQVLEINRTSVLLPIVAKIRRPGNWIVGIREDRPLRAGTTVAQPDIDQVIYVRQAVPVCITGPDTVGLGTEVVRGISENSLTVSIRTAIGCPDGQANGCRIARQLKEGTIAHWKVRSIEYAINGHDGAIESR